MTTQFRSLSRRQRRRLLVRGLLVAAALATGMVALYYLLPLNRFDVHLGVKLALGVSVLTVVLVWQVSAIVRSSYPAIRATQALAVMTPLFLLLFASTYFLMSTEDPANFTEGLTRSDSLYFTVTVFVTVGFGDISAQSETARLVVTVQMLLDLLVLGLGIKVVAGAVKKGKATSDDA